MALTLAASNSKSTAAQVFSPAASNSSTAQQQAIAIALAADAIARKGRLLIFPFLLRIGEIILEIEKR